MVLAMLLPKISRGVDFIKYPENLRPRCYYSSIRRGDGVQVFVLDPNVKAVVSRGSSDNAVTLNNRGEDIQDFSKSFIMWILSRRS